MILLRHCIFSTLRSLTLATSFNLHGRNLPRHLPYRSGLLFCKYREVTGGSIAPEEYLHSFHFDLSQRSASENCRQFNRRLLDYFSLAIFMLRKYTSDPSH